MSLFEKILNFITDTYLYKLCKEFFTTPDESPPAAVAEPGATSPSATNALRIRNMVRLESLEELVKTLCPNSRLASPNYVRTGIYPAQWKTEGALKYYRLPRTSPLKRRIIAYRDSEGLVHVNADGFLLDDLRKGFEKHV